MAGSVRRMPKVRSSDRFRVETLTTGERIEAEGDGLGNEVGAVPRRSEYVGVSLVAGAADRVKEPLSRRVEVEGDHGAGSAWPGCAKIANG